MQRILLVRHARPRLVLPKTTEGADLGNLIDAYDKAGASPDSRPPERVIRQANAAGLILTSPLPRARESAERLAGGRTVVPLPQLAEATIPYPERTRLRLPIAVWVLGLRLAWLAGWSPNAESRQSVAVRVRHAVDRMVSDAESWTAVLVVGHDVVNRYIARELRGRGWTGPNPIGPSPYWSVRIYEHPAARSPLIRGTDA